MILTYTQQCWSMTLHMFDIELRVSKRIHNYTQPNLLNRTHVWHWTGRDTLDPGGEIGHLSPGLWAQHVPPRQLEFKRSEPNVTFQILYVLTLLTLTNYAACILSAILCRDVVSQVPQCLWVALPECSSFFVSVIFAGWQRWQIVGQCNYAVCTLCSQCSEMSSFKVGD